MVLVTLLLHTLNLAFAKIPIGVHTVWTCLVGSLVIFTLSILQRLGVSTIVIRYDQVHTRKKQKNGTNEKMDHRYIFYSIQIQYVVNLFLQFATLRRSIYRHMASHAGITSIRSQSESCSKAWHSNNVRFYSNLNINV